MKHDGVTNFAAVVGADSIYSVLEHYEWRGSERTVEVEVTLEHPAYAGDAGHPPTAAEYSVAVWVDDEPVEQTPEEEKALLEALLR